MQGLGKVLDDPNKMVLFHYICQLLPEEAQTEFDRVAAAMLTGGVCVCGGGGGGGKNFDTKRNLCIKITTTTT